SARCHSWPPPARTLVARIDRAGSHWIAAPPPHGRSAGAPQAAFFHAPTRGGARGLSTGDSPGRTARALLGCRRRARNRLQREVLDAPVLRLAGVQLVLADAVHLVHPVELTRLL